MANLSEDLSFRGLIHQVTDPALQARLDTDRLTAYSGFDPTADSLHVGHLLQVCNLRRLQQAGHRPIALAGGGTGFVGDPGGKSEERVLLSEESLRSNLEGIRGQLERFLEFGDEGSGRALLVNNADWLEPMTLFHFLREVGKHFTVNQMVAKDSVKSRLSRAEQGISFTEFSYMLLQAYDFLHLFDGYECRLQLGGSDQWGNITMGTELVRKVRQQEVWGLTTPLVLKADGTKFGKTETGTVWLDPARTSPYQLYQYFLRSEDEVVGTYLRYFTFLDREAILALDESTAAHPERREAHQELARQVCTLVHGETETDRAVQASAALFGEGVALAGRGRAARRVRRGALDDPPVDPPRRRRAVSRGPAGRNRSGDVEEQRDQDHRAGRCLPQQPSQERSAAAARSGRPGRWAVSGAAAGEARVPPGSVRVSGRTLSG